MCKVMNRTVPDILGIGSPVGWWTVSTRDGLVVSMDWAGPQLPPGVKTAPESRLEQRLDCMLSRYFRGDAVDFAQVPVYIPEKPVTVAGVMRLLRTIPRGQMQSYQWLAGSLGNIRATRAVGGALGRNPVPIIIPCHRVIAKHGRLGGFMRNHPEGLRIKTFLLGLEGHAFAGDRLLPAREMSLFRLEADVVCSGFANGPP